jgi:hypothetical protein
MVPAGELYLKGGGWLKVTRKNCVAFNKVEGYDEISYGDGTQPFDTQEPVAGIDAADTFDNDDVF